MRDKVMSRVFHTSVSLTGLLWTAFTLVPTSYGNLFNIAVNKSTTTSPGVSFSSSSGRAVDGNTNQFYNDLSCSSTGLVDFPYWKVDLGAVYLIYFIRVYGRTDCCPERFSDITAEVTLDHIVYVHFDYHFGEMPSIHEYRPTTPKYGRWVKLSKPFLQSYLELCEVEVFARNQHEPGRFKMKMIDSVIGTAQTLAAWPVVNSIQECVFLCYLEPTCFSLHVFETTSTTLNLTTSLYCQLFASAACMTSGLTNVKYYELDV